MCPGESDGDVATQRPLSLWRAVLAAIDAAPQPAEGADCSGSPEGRCASLWDGPAAHPSPDSTAADISYQLVMGGRPRRTAQQLALSGPLGDRLR